MDNYYFAKFFVSIHIIIRNCYNLLLVHTTLVKTLAKQKEKLKKLKIFYWLQKWCWQINGCTRSFDKAKCMLLYIRW